MSGIAHTAIKDLAHSKLGASSMDRWSNCPGSIRISKGIKATTSKYAEEGTLAHEVAATLLLGEQPKNPVPDEMLEAVQVYVDAVREDIENG